METALDATGSRPAPTDRQALWSAVVAGSLAAGLFVLDLWCPKGLPEPSLYVIVVLVFLWSPLWRYSGAVAGGCSLLTLLGFVLPHVPSAAGDMSISVAITDRVFSLLVVWLTTILGLRMNRLSEQLSASESRTRAIVEVAAEAIITISQTGEIQSWNKAAERLFGYTHSEVTGRGATILMREEDRERHRRGLADYLATGRTHVMDTTRELVGRRKDGTVFPLLISVSEMWLGPQRMFVGILSDMTELRRAQDRAVQAERLAAIGQAMTGLAHESRNALQRSQAALEMLGRTVADRLSAMDLIRRIQVAQDDLHRLYEEVRNYAAPVSIQPQCCRVDRLLHEAWDDLSVSWAGRDARLVEAPSHVPWNCELDPFAMQQVFRNILENSLYASDGAVRIQVEFRDTQLRGRDALVISLRDDGPGLSAEARQRLFEPFFTTRTSGTGLGMPIAKRLIEAHGGQIDVRPDLNPGAEFQITLPRKQP